jgi:hypothetical protein
MAKHILVALSADPPGLGAELEQWSKDHVQHMVHLPEFTTAQAFRAHPRHNFVFPETRATRPPYQNLCIYELDENQIESFLNPNVGDMEPPQPPGGVGPHRPDGYLFVAVSPEYRGA